jgi:hypothetical protein
MIDPAPLTTERFIEHFKSQLKDCQGPRLVNPVRKIVFTIRSRDQGWTSRQDSHENTFEGSWTWFEAGLEKFEEEKQCKWEINTNNSPLNREFSHGADALTFYRQSWLQA